MKAEQVSNDTVARLMHYARQMMPNGSLSEVAELAQQMCVDAYTKINGYRDSHE